MPSKTNPGIPTKKRDPQLDAIGIQLTSQRPSDVWRGMDQVRQWLKENPENREVYGLLLDAVKENRELRDKVRALFIEMMQNGSKSAQEALSSLPTGIQDLLVDADDAYYAAEYEKAVQLYRQVLRLDPENPFAKDHLAKAEIKRVTGESVTGLPRVAEQYYRRARSYIAAQDVVTAMNLLSAAIEASKAKGMKYPDAEEALSNMQNLLIAGEFKQKAKMALDKNQWEEALDLYKKGLKLDATNEVMQKELESLQNLLYAESILKKRGVLKILLPVNQLHNTVESARMVMTSGNPLLSFVERQLGQIRLSRAIGIILLLIVIIFSLDNKGTPSELFTPALTDTPPIIFTATDTPEAISTNTEQKATASIIPTNTPSPTPTETLTPTPTEVILGIGYINKGIASMWDAPNGILIERLKLNHPLTILEKKVVTNFLWYRCRWDNSSGVTYEGWILAEYVTFGPPQP